MNIASFRERIIADKSVRTRMMTQDIWRDRKRARAGWPLNLFPFNGVDRGSGTILTLDMAFLTNAGFGSYLSCGTNYPALRLLILVATSANSANRKQRLFELVKNHERIQMGQSVPSRFLS